MWYDQEKWTKLRKKTYYGDRYSEEKQNITKWNLSD